MAEFFHVLITKRGNPESLLLADLSRADLQRQFLRFYRRGKKLTVSGRIVDPHNLDGVRIIKTEVAKETAMDALRQKAFSVTDRMNAEFSASGEFIMPPLYASETDIEHAGEDVTAIFVTGAPGSDSSLRDYLHNPWVTGIGTAVIAGAVLWALIGG